MSDIQNWIQAAGRFDMAAVRGDASTALTTLLSELRRPRRPAKFGWDPIETQTTADASIPVVYGKRTLGGNIINAFVERRRRRRDWMNVLLALCEGEVESVAGITADTDAWDEDEEYEVGDHVTWRAKVYRCLQANRNKRPSREAYWVNDPTNGSVADFGELIRVDDTSLARFAQRSEVSVRLGGNNQTAIPGYENLYVRNTVHQNLPKGNSFSFAVDAVSLAAGVDITLTLPNGLYRYKNGRYRKAGVRFRIDWSEYNGFDWDGEGIAVKSKTKRIVESSVSAFSRVFSITKLAPGTRWQVRVTKISSNSKYTGSQIKLMTDLELTDWSEVRPGDITYPNTALLAIKMVGTEAVSGTIPQIRVEVEGMKVETFTGGVSDGKSFSRNPVWCLYDFLGSRRYGLGRYLAGSLSPASQQAEADYCDELIPYDDDTSGYIPRFEMDTVIDGETSGSDLASKLASAFRGFPFWAGGLLRLAIDRPATVAHLYGMGNIIEGSFSGSFSPLSEVFNVVQVNFTGEGSENYDVESVQVVDSAALAEGEIERRKTTDLPGVVRRTQAVRMARYLLNASRYCRRTIRFRVATDAWGMLPGDIVSFSHDVPGWSVASGRVLEAGADWFSLDVEATLPALASGQALYIRLRAMDGTIFDREIVSAAGVYAVGDEIEITGGWPSSPEGYEVCAIGIKEPIDLVAKPFRVLSWAEAQNGGEIEVTASEYYEDIYSDTGDVLPPPSYTNLPNPLKPPEDVEELAAVVSGEFNSVVTLTWTIPEASASYGLWDRAEIWVSAEPDEVDEGTDFDEETTAEDSTRNYRQVGMTGESAFEMRALTPGYRYRARVVSVSKLGRRTLDEGAPEVEFVYNPLWGSDAVPDVTGLELANGGVDRVFTDTDAVFEWRKAASLATADGLGAGQEPLGAGQGALDQWFQDYRVEVWVSGQVVRQEFVTANRYTYTLAMNRMDNAPAAREFTLKVWARDIFNRSSLHAAELTVSNAEPSAPTGLTGVADFSGNNRWDLPKPGISYKHDVYDDPSDATAENPDVTFAGGVQLNWDAHSEPDVRGFRVVRRKPRHNPTFGPPYWVLLYDEETVFEGQGTTFFDILATPQVFDNLPIAGSSGSAFRDLRNVVYRVYSLDPFSPDSTLYAEVSVDTMQEG